MANYTIRAMISVQTLSFIASRFSYISGVFDSIISIIHQCFMRPISIMDRHIVNQMIHIMLSKQSASSYSSVMDPFKKLIISTACDTSFEASESEPLMEYPCMAIIYHLEIVAANLQAFTLKFRFMQDMLEIYIQLCFAFRKTPKTSIKANYLAIFINFVIKALSCVMQRIGRIVDMTSQTQQLFKNFWVCLVVMGSVNIAQNSTDILEYYKKISTFSPPLVVDHLRSDLRYNTSIEDNSLDPGDLSVTKNLLIDCLECKNQNEISNIGERH
ncbi:hypothetical protein MXB_5371 [Myxobolus squamalis]|nr:hypothetical protein MXB_5371 [Myxobolus squamalis]